MSLAKSNNDSLGRNAKVEASIVWPGSVAGVVFARTVIDGEDTLVVRCWCPNIIGYFAEFHYRSVEREAAAEAYETIVYGISKLAIGERRTQMDDRAFAQRMEGWLRDMKRDKRLAKTGLIPADVDWHY